MMRRRQLLAGLALASLGCRRGHSSSTERTGLTEADGPPPELPQVGDRYLLVGDRLPQLRKRAKTGDAAWERLLHRVDERLAVIAGEPDEVENLALVHLISEKPVYAKAALAAAKRAMARDVRADSYLQIGDIARAVALVLDHCGGALPAEATRELAEFLARWTHELWFDNKGSGWGLDDPGNNYHMAFLEGTAFAGYALAKRRDDRAKRLLQILHKKLEAVLVYLEGAGAGGDWHEGVNYGQRAKQRLLSALSAVASMGGPRYFDRTAFFRDAIHYAVYQLQPDRASLYPGGDLARDSVMRVSPYDRDYLQMAAFWVRDAQAKALGRWYLKEIAPSYEDKATFSFFAALYKDVLFANDGPIGSPERLPHWYQARGTGWINARSGWDADATSLCISAGRVLEQTHAHHDNGSFTLFKGGWQAVDAASYSRSGITWEAGAHNLVHVVGHERRMGEVGGLTQFHHARGLTYAQIDASKLFRKREDREEKTLVEEYTREIVFLEPSTVVVYDRVSAPQGVEYQQRTHFAEQPSEVSPGLYGATQGRGGMSLRVVLAGERTVVSDSDLDGGGSRAWRVQLAPAAGRFLTVLRVAIGAPPTLEAVAIETRDEVAGVVLDEHVVIFSARARGAPLDSWRYRVGDDKRRKHLVFDAKGGYDVRVRGSEIEVTRGSQYSAGAHGLLSFEV